MKSKVLQQIASDLLPKERPEKSMKKSSLLSQFCKISLKSELLAIQRRNVLFELSKHLSRSKEAAFQIDTFNSHLLSEIRKVSSLIECAQKFTSPKTFLTKSVASWPFRTSEARQTPHHESRIDQKYFCSRINS